MSCLFHVHIIIIENDTKTLNTGLITEDQAILGVGCIGQTVEELNIKTATSNNVYHI